MNAKTLAPTATRLLLGLTFAVFGLNGFLNFLPAPTPTGAAAEFLGGLAATGYFFPLLKGTEIAVGLLLLTNRWVPLALVVLAPITINILAYHKLAPEGLPLALGITALHLIVAWFERASFRPLFQSASQPTAA